MDGKVFSILIKLFSLSAGVGLFYKLAELFNKAFGLEAPGFYDRMGFLVAGFLLGILIAPYFEKWLISAQAGFKIHAEVFTIRNGIRICRAIDGVFIFSCINNSFMALPSKL